MLYENHYFQLSCTLTHHSEFGFYVVCILDRLTLQHILSAVGWGVRGAPHSRRASEMDGSSHFFVVGSGASSFLRIIRRRGSIAEDTTSAFHVSARLPLQSTRWNESTAPHPFDSGKMASMLRTAVIQVSPPYRHRCCCCCCCCCFRSSAAKILT